MKCIFLDYGWVDGELVKILSDAMNFKINYVNNTGRNHFGDITPYGNYTGILHALENEEADLAANLRTIQTTKLGKAISLYPVHPKAFSILVPKRPHNFQVSYVGCIEWCCGMIVIFFIFSVYMAWIILDAINKRIKLYDEPSDSLRIAVVIFGTLLITSQPAPKSRYAKCLITGVIICSMILSSTYQAKMVQHLNTSKQSSDIINVEELLESNLKINIPISLKGTIFVESLLSDTKLARGKTLLVTTNSRQVIDDLVTKKNSAFIAGALFCEFLHAQLYDDKGNRYTHVIRNVKTMPSSMMTIKRSPFRYRFNHILLSLCENGVMNKVFEDYNNEIAALNRKVDSLQKEIPNCYTMDQLEYIFVVFCASLGGCFLVFLGEILVSFCQIEYRKWIFDLKCPV